MKKCLSQWVLCGCLTQAALAAQPPALISEPMAPPSQALRVPPEGQGDGYQLAGVSQDTSGNELSYGAYIDSTSRLKCLYGYAADKTGDHAAAIQIFEDCIARWEDVYSMIWLAMMHENGTGLPRDLGKAAELMHRGALSPETAGYATLARYHYGVALHQGRGVPRDAQAARHWLARASAEGQGDAAAYLQLHFPPSVR
jgi:TPR repeat protein